MKISVLRIDKGVKQNFKDSITSEIPLTVYLNEKELLTLSCSPDHLKELSVGFLYTSGIIKSIDEIKSVIIDRQNWISNITLKNSKQSPDLLFKRLYTSGCGRGTIFYSALDKIHANPIRKDRKISAEKILELMKSFQKMSTVFKETGGVHSAALSDGEVITAFKEDIGRHNAIDKLTGEALIKKINLEDSLLFTSGRLSSEIVSKVQKMGPAFLISRSAPTDQAIRAAKALNLTLVGFVRGQRMNVYSAAERIL